MNIIGGSGETQSLSFDTLISYPLVKKFAPILNYFNITANQVTIFNIFFRIYILYDLYYKNSIYLIYFLILTHFIDCLDGTVARMYNQKTKFGAKLDHWSDKVFWPCIFIIIINKCKTNNFIQKIIIILFILIIYSVLICEFKKKCFFENNIQQPNAIISILIIYSLYKKC
jgi:phosphatidylglycerophosphate synthase